VISSHNRITTLSHYRITALSHHRIIASPHYRITALSHYLKHTTMIIKTHKELDVYKLAFATALEIFEITKSFPAEERYSLTDQIRRSSRSVCANIGEAFRKRRYEKHFISKLSDSESEAAETQVWLQFALAHNYITNDKYLYLDDKYDHIISMLVKMQNNSKTWSLK